VQAKSRGPHSQCRAGVVVVLALEIFGRQLGSAQHNSPPPFFVAPPTRPISTSVPRRGSGASCTRPLGPLLAISLNHRKRPRTGSPGAPGPDWQSPRRPNRQPWQLESALDSWNSGVTIRAAALAFDVFDCPTAYFTFTGNPPYSIPPYSCPCSPADLYRCGSRSWVRLSPARQGRGSGVSKACGPSFGCWTAGAAPAPPGLL
jgi:hypothetical protein